MKKLVQILTAAVISVGFIGSVASATTDCQTVVYNSGDNNPTTIECINIKTIDITCVNNVTVANISYQDGKSGPAIVGGNEAGGSATTGTVTNSNNTTTELGVTGCAGAVTPSVSPSVSPSPSVTPASSVTPGKGATTPVTPTVLPYTAGNSAAEIVAVSLVSAAGVVVASRLAIAAYRRFSEK
ncbi:MAG: hypothetical protein JWN75_310 [Candidatus Saccharibacteria bacterium]|nr:hypothetical protein [Candidatus Saccharibacteria bacterium]